MSTPHRERGDRVPFVAVLVAAQVAGRLGPGVRVVIAPLMRIEPRGPLPGLAPGDVPVFTSESGAEAFAARCKEAERAARADAWDAVRAMLPALIREFAPLRDEVEAHLKSLGGAPRA